MISTLALTGWRAYDEVEIDFEPGVTFVVARNGIGKTSLLQGAAFALFGERSGYATSSAIRAGHEAATATVRVFVSDEETLTITRTLTAKKVTTSAEVDGRTLDERSLDEMLRSTFGADVGTLARLFFLPAGSLVDYAEEKVYLHQHLCRLFGVDHLESVRDDVKKLRTEARSELRKVKETNRTAEAEVVGWREELERIGIEHESISSRVDGVRSDLRDAQAVVDLAGQYEQFEAQRAARQEAMEDLGSQVTRIMGVPIDAHVDLTGHVAELEEEATAHGSDLERARGRLEGRIEMLEVSRHQLDDAEADCPVCLRPLDGETRDRAAARHEEELGRSRREVAKLTLELEDNAHRKGELVGVRRALSDLPGLPESPLAVTPEQLIAAQERVEAASTRVRELDEQAATLRARAKALQIQLDDDVVQAEQHRVAVGAYRREALVEATSVAVDAMIERLVSDRIEPLAEQVAARWKTVFKGSRPVLRLEASGELKLMRGDTAIEFADMSAGERAVALLVTRMLVLSVTTRSGFMWLDEPLEQLDPSNRRLIAQLLTASPGGPVHQLIVTTFEEQIARRLEQQVPGVHLQYVTSGD